MHLRNTTLMQHCYRLVFNRESIFIFDESAFTHCFVFIIIFFLNRCLYIHMHLLSMHEQSLFNAILTCPKDKQ